MLLWWSHLWIFSHVFLIIFFMSDFLCYQQKLTNLVFRYRSSKRMCVSVSRTAVNIILYILTITCKYLFCILISFLINLFLWFWHVILNLFMFRSVCQIITSCIKTNLIITLYIWYTIVSVTFQMNVVIQTNILIWVFILFSIFFICSSHHS